MIEQSAQMYDISPSFFSAVLSRSPQRFLDLHFGGDKVVKDVSLSSDQSPLWDSLGRRTFNFCCLYSEFAQQSKHPIKEVDVRAREEELSVFRENPPDLAPGYREGIVQETGGLETCVAGPSDADLAILLISDVLVDLSKPDFDSHGQKGHEDAKLLIAALRSKGMDSIGAAGSCWGFDSHVKILPGVSHGWTVRYNVEDETAAGSAAEDHGDMIHSFTK
ncbi:hypothetical protein NC653_037664 [Populus alba x Populus x berolinensis]|uniref:Uncharacterized protein n=1 Tax=Populus alba x Populus x berolinensis TaxID=444605 RepID=A0AAD6PSC0_9ROSI|nr:hypothetical protein NC653_037664 [Populus alba x Populus x berolinensis]